MTRDTPRTVLRRPSPPRYLAQAADGRRAARERDTAFSSPPLTTPSQPTSPSALWSECVSDDRMVGLDGCWSGCVSDDRMVGLVG